jgi:glycosyltransferase involved in cell wall biosynthesis
MHIAVAGPVTLSLLRSEVSVPSSIPGYPFAGTSELVLEYLSAGHEVSVVTTSPAGVAAPTWFRGTMLNVCVVPSRGRARSRALDFFEQERTLIEQGLEESGADICHAHWTYEFGLAAQRSSLPAVVTVHDWAPAIARMNRHPYWWFRALMQVKCLTGGAVLTAPSSYIADRVRKVFRRPCHIVPNGTRLTDFSAGSGTPHHPLRVGMLNVGFSDRKNTRLAMKAFDRLRQTGMPVELDVAGVDYEHGGSANRWAEAEGLTSGVNFLGPLEPGQVPRWMSGLDLFLHPSREESFGMVLVEAMAAGLPIIAGRSSGAVPEVLGGEGVLVDITDANAMTAAMLAVLQSEETRLAATRSGPLRAQTFDVSRSAKSYLRIFDDVLRAVP